MKNELILLFVCVLILVVITCILLSAIWLAKNKDIYVKKRSKETYKLLFHSDEEVILRNMNTGKKMFIDIYTFKKEYELKTFK